MSTRRKIAFSMLAVLALVVAAAVILVPMLVDANRYRPQVVERIRLETGMPAEIGRLTLTLFPTFAIRVDDFALSNPEGFPPGHLVTAQRVYAVLDGGALWNRQIVIKSIELNKPEINLLQKPGGQWNFQAHERLGIIKKAALVEAPPFSLGLISKVTISDGKISASRLSPSGEPEPAFFDAQEFSCQLKEVDLSAFSIKVSKSLAPPPTRNIARAVWWRPRFAYAAAIEATPAAQGTMGATALHFQTFHATAMSSKLRLYAKELFLDDLAFDLYEGHAQGEVDFNFAGINPHYGVKMQASGINVAKLIAQSPGSRVWMTGKFQGNLTLDGDLTHSPDPFAGMQGSGRLSVRDGTLPLVRLDKNMVELAKLSNLGAAKGDPRSFSSVVADFKLLNNKISSKKIIVAGNGLSAEGSGSMTLAGDGSLDYRGVANILAGTNQLTNIIAGMSGATLSKGRMILPFTIGGTLKFPKFNLKKASTPQFASSENRAQGKVWPGLNLPAAQPNPGNLIQGFSDAFKKKKSP